MIYDYKCNECELVWEITRAVSQRDDVAICPDCTSTDTKRCVSYKTSFQLKGTGWERDGYATHTGDALKMKKHKRFT